MAQLELRFLQEWLQVRNALGPLDPDDQHVKVWLYKSYARAASPPPKPHPPLLRRLLLLRRMRGSARAARLLYWTALLLFNLLVTLAGFSFAAWYRTANNSDLAGAWALGSISLFVGLAAAGLRTATIKADIKARKERRLPRWPSDTTPPTYQSPSQPSD
ncbi:hypothetical protein [Streptomyces xanthophaeus]